MFVTLQLKFDPRKKIHQIPSIMQTGQRDGMITMEKSIENLVNSGKISPIDAKE